MEMPAAFLVARTETYDHFAGARYDTPAIPQVIAARPVRRMRVALAAALNRAATAVAPVECETA
jgi:hypothetical protein